MPFAGYKNFEACVVSQKGKGHSDESAHKICGYLKNKLEKNTDMSETIAKETWSTAYVNSLPDANFLYVESGGKKDEEGKTKPRSLRHFPVKDKNGKVDLAHVRNALARIPDSKVPASVKDKCTAKAKRMLNSAEKTKKADTIIEKARMVVKPINPKGYIIGNVQPTGSASLDPKKAGKLNDIRGLKDPKKTKKSDPGNSEYSIEAPSVTANDFPPPAKVEDDNVSDSAVEMTRTCTYCGSQYTSNSFTDEDRAVGVILAGSEMIPTPDSTDGVQTQKAYAVKLQKSAQAEEEHYVLGVVLEPEVEDSQGDIYSAEEIRKSAHLFMQNFANIGLQHNGHINDKAKILESYIAPADFTLNEQVIKKGTWLLGARILDDELWQAVKKGEITGWSIGGSAIRTPIEATN